MGKSGAVTFGVIIGNRDVFPRELAAKGRKEVLSRLESAGVEAVAVSESETPSGVVETIADAEACARLFRGRSGDIDGVFVCLPNFGDERAVANAIKWSGLDVPVFVHAYPDELGALSNSERRDAFCGKLSVCNNLRQYGVKYSLGRSHVVHPSSEEFVADVTWFATLCRVVKGVKNARVGCLGARTTAFNTVRYSERLLEAAGVSVETKSLLDAVSQMHKLGDGEARVREKLEELVGYVPGTERAPKPAVLASAKLAVVLEEWIRDCRLDAVAIQCWPAMQDAIQMFPCNVMSLLSNGLVPAACETDVMGALAMYALQLSGGSPSGVFDWNNNFGDDGNRMILFHCGNCPVSMMSEASTGFNMIASKSQEERFTYCTIHGAMKPGKIAFARLATDEINGKIRAVIGDGEITNDTIETFGSTGVLRVGRLQDLLYVLAISGFEHHVALNYGARTDVLFEAFTRYLGWEVYYHDADTTDPALQAGTRRYSPW